jgi:hypothetical protein
MLAGRPDAFRANSTSSERRLTRVASPRPVYGDALASFRNTGANSVHPPRVVARRRLLAIASGLTVTVSVASAVVTTAALTGLVELRDEASSAPNVRHKRNDGDLHSRLRNRRHPRRIERPPLLQWRPFLAKGAAP